ncbi:hypothetical protein PR003_g13162 [Phytophthora rubi]|uniref:Uncharacterized protein n=1 Tax=Phytophthora rubi TaxID=129364 RepID=A0A6A4F6J1_9STRA|nr:hypothetical protein PR002_g12475 [Phytophthora rubi]KAE9335138.1 hypothetical protein PR003_g13162 [Phytophthora rubi]
MRRRKLARQTPRELYNFINNIGHVAENWPEKDICAICFMNGEH